MLSEIIKPYALSPQEKKKIFITELLKSGVEPQQAVKVANILATETPEEALTSEELQLVNAACEKWLKEHQRRTFVNSTLQQFTVD